VLVVLACDDMCEDQVCEISMGTEVHYISVFLKDVLVSVVLACNDVREDKSRRGDASIRRAEGVDKHLICEARYHVDADSRPPCVPQEPAHYLQVVISLKNIVWSHQYCVAPQREAKWCHLQKSFSESVWSYQYCVAPQREAEWCQSINGTGAWRARIAV
jgi:hypothetical protein